jgi:Pyridoxamine 5'-phosphate oxidase
VRWEDVERQAPQLAGVMHDRLLGPGVLLVATIRLDGTPRLSPVEPLVLDGDLWLSMMWQSRKATDLLRDDRILVHSITTTREGGEGELKVRGSAQSINDPTLRRRYCDAVAVLGWRPEEPYFHLFRIDIADVTLVRYAPTGDQYVARWPAGTEFVRRETSPTSVGHAEPVVDLFHPNNDHST